MTAPEDPNDLREAVARDYVLVKRGLYYRPDSLGYTGVLDDAGRYTAEDAKFHNDHCSDVKGILVSEAPRFSSACWPEIITRTLEADLAKARADLERVTAERDEARATNRRLHRRLQAVEGPMQSRLHFQKWLLDYRFRAFARVRRRALVAEAENTRLRALLVDLKTKADGQLAYWRQRMAREKCLDDGVSEDGQTYTPIGDSAAWQGGYCNGRLSEADWWRSTLKYDLPAPPTPAQTDTAPGGRADG